MPSRNSTALELLALPSMAALYVSDNPFGSAFDGTLSPNIHTLELRNTGVDDEAIAVLPRLRCIDVPGSRVTPGGVAHLINSAINLQSLSLDGSQIDSVSVSALADSPRLLELCLHGEGVMNASIASLGPVGLRELALSDTAVNDMAVPYIAAIPGLCALSLGSELSQDAIATLRALRPRLFIREPSSAQAGSVPR